MKKIASLLIILIFAPGAASQAPEKMSFQAVIRNTSGELVKNHLVQMKISILKGSPAGTAVYVETDSAYTNVNGLATIEIGGGIPITGLFSEIDWLTGPYFIKTEVDPDGWTNYSITGISQLLSVPYALYSNTAGMAVNAATKSSVESLRIEYERLRDKLYEEFPTLKEKEIVSEQILTSGKTGYGNSISVSGNLAVVGAGWENTAQANKAGAVYIYEYIDNQWIEKQRLTNPSGSYDRIFGHSVVTNGQYIIVTEPWNESVYIYSKVNSVWTLEKKITVTDISSEIFGISVDLFNNTIVIGSGAVFATYCSAVGSVYVYENNGTDWINTARLIPSGGLSHDCFGASVSIDGDTIAVGARRYDCYAGTQGYVCIFEKNGTVWSEKQKIYAPDGTDGNGFGYLVDMENGKLMICSPGTRSNYYFEKGDTWEFKQKFISPNESGQDSFGHSVSLNGNYALMGAFDHDEAYTNQGAVYLFELEETGWTVKLKIIPSIIRENGIFGSTLYLTDDFVFASGGASDTALTNVYIFKLQ